ncbi:MAG: 2-oxoglutarate and iron-dependent oxygenase domain-containing protein [Pseudomonadota bacterium]
MIPVIDAGALLDSDSMHHEEMQETVAKAATGVGFMVVENTPISANTVAKLIEHYRSFFYLSDVIKSKFDMAKTGSNRGWGASGSEQVDPDANPDFKQVFDCGSTLSDKDPSAALNLPAYAPNLWPDTPAGFSDAVKAYYEESTAFALDLLCAIAGGVGEDPHYFRDQFSRPMALLRGNFYPERPSWAGAKDFGIAPHTDYGCLTLLATDGSPGLEVRLRGGGWEPVTVGPGAFVINFGEMLEFWTDGKIKATPHRVVGSSEERISVPLFFNPNHDTNIAPTKSKDVIQAVDHLQKRYSETYVHLKASRTFE